MRVWCRSGCHWASLLLACPFAAAFADERPSALRRIEQERAAWNTGRLNWVHTISRVGRVPRHYESTHSRGDGIIVFRGDDEGVVGRDRNGKPQEDIGYGPIYTLVREGEQWQYLDGAPSAEVVERDARGLGVVSMRSLGLSPTLSGATVEKALWDPDGTRRRFSERSDRGLIIVNAETDAYTIRWFIDPDRGGIPNRVVLEQNGRPTHECQIAIARFGETWYPQTVEYYDLDHGGTGQPIEVIEVLDIQPNPPDLSRSGFIPADIRVDSGVNIIRRDANFQPIVGMFKWDGEKAVPLDDWNRRSLAGELTSGPIFNANYERALALDSLRKARAAATRPGASDIAIVNVVETEWEAFVRSFIVRYRLDGDQTQKAVLHLDKAKAAAAEFAVREKTKLEQLDSQRTEIDALREPQRTARARAWDDQRRALLQPLDQVFLAQLKPSLERLPTRTQRKLGDPPAASRPSHSGPTSRPAGD